MEKFYLFMVFVTLRKIRLIFSVALTLTVSVTAKATATAFTPAPLFDQAGYYSTTLAGSNDLADIYFPQPSNSSTGNSSFPVALLLQGALVDKSFYSDYASLVARYGFIVVVPNHVRTVSGFSGLFSETSQIEAVLSQIRIENLNPTSPVQGLVDTQKLGLLGHSLGAAVGLSAIANQCLAFYCEGSFSRPAELQAGAFFGANLRDPITGEFVPIDNSGIPIALLQGDRDSRALPFRASITYENIQSPPKTLITILGANHFGITDVNNPPGAFPDPNAPTLPQDVAIETIARWSGLFLRASLLNDKDAFNYIYSTGDALDPNVRTISTVPEPSSTLGFAVLVVIFSISYQRKFDNNNKR